MRQNEMWMNVKKLQSSLKIERVWFKKKTGFFWLLSPCSRQKCKNFAAVIWQFSPGHTEPGSQSAARHRDPHSVWPQCKIFRARNPRWVWPGLFRLMSMCTAEMKSFFVFLAPILKTPEQNTGWPHENLISQNTSAFRVKPFSGKKEETKRKEKRTRWKGEKSQKNGVTLAWRLVDKMHQIYMRRTHSNGFIYLHEKKSMPLEFTTWATYVYTCTISHAVPVCEMQYLQSHLTVRHPVRSGSRILVRGAQQSFDPRSGPWAQNLLKIGIFSLKLLENCMILNKPWGQGGHLDPLVSRHFSSSDTGTSHPHAGGQWQSIRVFRNANWVYIVKARLYTLKHVFLPLAWKFLTQIQWRKFSFLAWCWPLHSVRTPKKKKTVLKLIFCCTTSNIK